MPQNPPKKRCTATTKKGRRCRRAAMRGHTLCYTHARGSRMPGPDDRRCTATTAGGDRCPHWAVRGTKAQYGRLLCSVHLPAGDPRKNTRRLPREGERRCAATTAGGRRCSRWAMHGHSLCHTHAHGNRLPGPDDRRCTATTAGGERCPHWAVRGTRAQYGHYLCPVHLPPHDPRRNARPLPPEGEQRCAATTPNGKRCPQWAIRGHTLCHAHAGRHRPPGPDERRCTATTVDGNRCPHWAVRGTRAQYGRHLCPVHLPPDDPRHAAWHLPSAGERRCTATTQDGERCRRWAMVHDEESPHLCRLHAYPEEHPRIRHGYYRATLPLGQVELEAIRLAHILGPDLLGEIVLVRLVIRMLLAYVTESELPLGQDMNSVRLIFRHVRLLARILLARQEMEKTRQAPQQIGSAFRLWGRLPPEASAEPQGAAADWEALSDLQKEALLLLARAGDRELKWDVGLVRIMLRRVLGYVTHTQGLSVAERIDLLEFFIMGAGTVADLMYRGRSLLPGKKS